ncbi:MAG: C13 family peptidase [Nevskiaceae bacterium]
MNRLRDEGLRVLALLGAGLRLTLLSPPRPFTAEVTAVSFLAILALGVLASFWISYFAVEPPRAFSVWGVQSEGFYILVSLALCFVTAAALSRRDATLPLAALVFSAGLLAGSVQALFQDQLMARLMEREERIYWLVFAWWVLWWIAIWHRALAMLDLGRPLPRAACAVAAIAAICALQFTVTPSRLWDRDYSALYERERPPPSPLVAEEVFADQGPLLERALAGIEPGVPGRPDLYFVAFGPYGDQDVFLKESLYSSRLFETRFGAEGRTLTLVNNARMVGELPLATVTNLGRSLEEIGARMNRDEDILFLFLTSHGSQDASLSIQLRNLSFKPLTAPGLASMLNESGIRWKVLVVSGCYSGTFLDALKDDHTLVISAARADRTSFGCSDGAEFTYFGRAFFQRALNQTRSFTEAYAIASRLVADWEKNEGRVNSEPQMVAGRRIEAHLARWRETLAE